MARPSGPWWCRERSRWAATISGRRVSAPEKSASATRRPPGPGTPSGRPRPRRRRSWRPGPLAVAEVFEAYLEALAGRIVRGEVAAVTYRMTRSSLTTAWGFAVGGRKFGEIPAAAVKTSDLESILGR